MRNSKSYTDLAKLEKYGDTLSIATSDSKMSDTLQQFGVSAEVLEEGKNLLSDATTAYNESYANKKKRIEVSKTFVKALETLYVDFRADRKKSQIALLNNELAQGKLELNRRIPGKRFNQFEMARTFYIVLSENPDLLEALAKLGISSEYVTAKLAVISEVEKARVNLMLQNGISQNATNVKNRAMNNLSRWMSKFYSVSREAFKENPQLLEAFGVVVKN